MNDICLDTGVIHLFLSKNPKPQVIELMEKIKNGSVNACIVAPVISELTYHVCKIDGRERALAAVNSFLKQYPVSVVETDTSLVLSAGVLKCQHRKLLSYIDCISIALCIRARMEFHSTEKKLKDFPGNVLQHVKVVRYTF